MKTSGMAKGAAAGLSLAPGRGISTRALPPGEAGAGVLISGASSFAAFGAGAGAAESTGSALLTEGSGTTSGFGIFAVLEGPGLSGESWAIAGGSTKAGAPSVTAGA